jgi:hypothetical protein
MHSYDQRGLLKASSKDGWTLGYIASPWPGPWPKTCGDLFVQAPDGTQAGIAWETKGPAIEVICGASNSRWGVFQVLFPIPVFSEADLIRNFHAILPLLQEEHRNANKDEQQ